MKFECDLLYPSLSPRIYSSSNNSDICYLAAARATKMTGKSPTSDVFYPKQSSKFFLWGVSCKYLGKEIKFSDTRIISKSFSEVCRLGGFF